MFRTLSAKFPGTCERCKQTFPIGTRVRWNGRACWHLKMECPGHEPEPQTPALLCSWNASSPTLACPNLPVGTFGHYAFCAEHMPAEGNPDGPQHETEPSSTDVSTVSTSSAASLASSAPDVARDWSF